MFYRGDFTNYQSLTSAQMLNESLDRARMFTKSSLPPTSGITVFLSHKHNDLDLGELDGVIGMLRQFNVVPYIDSMDKEMPVYTCAATAKRIKEVIEFCRKFILLATNSAIESYWCNWEVGIGDVHKYKENIAILPMADKGKDYKGNEYLKLYPSIEYFKEDRIYSNGAPIKEGFYVRSPHDERYTITPLDTWLKSINKK